MSAITISWPAGSRFRTRKILRRQFWLGLYWAAYFYQMLLGSVRRHKKLIYYSTQGGLTWLLGYGLLYLLITHYGLNDQLANLLVSKGLAPLGFIFNWAIWRDSQVSKGKKTSRWWAAWLGFWVLNLGFYYLLTHLGVAPLTAKPVMAVPVSLVSYQVHKRWVFGGLK